MAIAPLLLSYLGFAALCCAMRRHRKEVFDDTYQPLNETVCRVCGWSALTLSLVPCVFLWPGSVAIVAWLGILSMAAFVQVLVLTFAPKAMFRLALAGAVGLVVTAVAGM
jgi:hypothetical protein